MHSFSQYAYCLSKAATTISIVDLDKALKYR